MLEQIKRKVEEKVNASNQQIILGMYRKMIHAHNCLGGCGCEYCTKLRVYVDLKKRYSRYTRMMNSPCYCYYTNDNVVEDLDYLANIKAKIKELKISKDNLKILA